MIFVQLMIALLVFSRETRFAELFDRLEID